MLRNHSVYCQPGDPSHGPTDWTTPTLPIISLARAEHVPVYPATVGALGAVHNLLATALQNGIRRRVRMLISWPQWGAIVGRIENFIALPFIDLFIPVHV